MTADATILDEREVREDRHPGSSTIHRHYWVLVTGASGPREAREVARWRAEHEAPGEVEQASAHFDEMTDDGAVYRVEVRFLRYW